jgi:hypothetical protein
MSIILQSSGGGSVTIAEPATASNFTQTLPAATGTVMVSGNMPAFSAYAGSQTTLTNNVYTKVLFDTEEFDTNNNFASSRFTPTVAGYYQLNAAFQLTGIAATETVIALYKNGSVFKYGIDIVVASTGTWALSSSFLVYANGTTDYFEIYAYQNSSRNTAASFSGTWFNGSMVRGA